MQSKYGRMIFASADWLSDDVIMGIHHVVARLTENHTCRDSRTRTKEVLHMNKPVTVMRILSKTRCVDKFY